MVGKARSSALERAEIEFFEALIPASSGRLPEARSVPDHLETASPAHYYVSVTEMYYWYQLDDVERFRSWYRKAWEQADTESRRKDLLNRLAGFYTKLQAWEDCIETYRKLAAIDADDPWLWHDMGIAYIRTDRIKDAKACNDRALQLMHFGAAHRSQQYIQKQRPGWKRWFRRRACSDRRRAPPGSINAPPRGSRPYPPPRYHAPRRNPG